MKRGKYYAIISLVSSVAFFTSLLIMKEICWSKSPKQPVLEEVLAVVIYLAIGTAPAFAVLSIVCCKRKILTALAVITAAVLIPFAVHAVWWVPRFLPVSKFRWGNESGPISALRTISSAQELYNTRYATYGTLAQLDAGNMIDSVLANATTVASAKSGYYFVMRLGIGAWCCGARAAKWGVTGERSFRISQDGYIYYSEKDEDMTITTSGTPLGG